jgi:hypothetical protein
MSSYYSNLIASQNELSNSLASENINIEANNIRRRTDYDKTQKDLTDQITGIQQKIKTEGGKKELVGGIPLSEDDIAGVLGGKATYNLGKNIVHLAKNGLDNPVQVSRVASSLNRPGGLQRAMIDADPEGGGSLAEATSGALEESTTLGDKVATMGKQAVAGAKQVLTGTPAQKSITQLTSSGEAVGEGAESLVEGAGRDIEKTASGVAKDIIGKAGAGLSIASGLELGAGDIEGLAKGEGWNALGDNTEERVSNVLNLAGDVASVVPGGEIIGGLLDLAGGIFDFFGEKKEAKEKQAQAQQLAQQKANQQQPTPQSSVIHPSLATLGIVSNVSHPVAQMITQSGSF